MKPLVLAALVVATGPAMAHDGVIHKTPEDAARHRAEAPPLPEGPVLPFPVKVGGAFTLTDGAGEPRTEADPDGRMQLLFFGYANCPSICAVALPMMAEATDALRAEGIDVRPVMVTVDPDRDTVDTIAAPLKAIHPDFVGLTGTEADLQPVWDLYNIERNVVFVDPEHGEVFAHGSFIYLLDATGAVQTVLPPILGPERVTEIALRYAGS